MPLTGTGDALGAAIKSAIDGADPKDRDALFAAMGNAIIDHIVENGVGAIAFVAGVTPGGALSGPGNLT